MRHSLISLALVLSIAPWAQAQSKDDLAGVWKRVGKIDRYYVFEATEDGVSGRLSNPPFKSMQCELTLGLKGNKVRGPAKWIETVGDKEYREKTTWEFTLNGKELKGRAEVIDWEEGVVYSREWANYTLIKVERVGLVTSGSVDDEVFSDELGELTQYEGGWSGNGKGWSASVVDGQLVLTAVGHSGGAAIKLKNERGSLRGQVKLAGVTCKVELGLSEGKLAGRSSWKAGPVEGWAPISFERLERTELGEGAELNAARPSDSEGELVGAWKRDDGLYLRVSKQGGEVKGALSAKNGTIKARLTFSLKNGAWVGLVNWGSYETTWELAVAGDDLKGRTQWTDLHDGKLVSRGWASRAFTRLKRLH